MKILKFEHYKMLHKKENYIFVIFLFGISLLFAGLMGSNSEIMVLSGTDELGAMDFSAFVYSFISGLLLLQIIYAVVVSGIWASEFGDGTIAHILLAAKDRRQVFVWKSCVTLLYNVFLLIALFASSWLFYILVGKSGSHYTDDFMAADFMALVETSLIAYFSTMFLMILFTSAMVTLLSMLESRLKALLYYIVLLVVMKILEQIDAISEYVPSHMFDVDNVFMKDWNHAVFVRGAIVIIVLSGAIYVASYIIFKRKNIN